MSDAPKHLYWKGDALLIYTKTHGPEWDALMERALEARRLITDSPVAWNAQDVLRDLLAYLGEQP